MKINYKNLTTEKGLEISLQILTLIIGIFSFAFIISGAVILETKNVSALDISSLSAGKNCCINSKSDMNCKEFSSSECSTKCDGECNPADCSQISECSLGCCFDKDEGLCDPNSQKQRCESQPNGKFFDDYSCNVWECTKGCCILGLESQFVTEQTCKKRAAQYGVTFKFETGVKDELACIGESETGKEKTGACLIGTSETGLESEKRNCKFTTMDECTAIGEFYENYLCSNTKLNTNCEKQKETKCFDGLDGVYWIDSCGNKENIYSSDKDKSWNNGMVKDKEQICSSSSAIESSSCGNCDYTKGSICGIYRPSADTKPKDGNYVCRDLNCKQAPGNAGAKKDRINGESWCVYDGQIGAAGLGSIPGVDIIGSLVGGTGALSLSADVVGSRHFRYICVNGDVKVEPCADYRKEICVELDKSSSEKTSSGKTNSMCRVNMWENCIGLNGRSGCEGACLLQCKINPDCRIQNVNVDKDFKFNACVPKYPPGFDLGNGIEQGIEAAANQAGGEQLANLRSSAGQIGNILGGGTNANNVCGLGTQTCTVTYIKKCEPNPKWVCVSNCKCMEQGFTIQMNNLCLSLGDCGAYTNIAGVVTNGGYSVSKKGSKGHAPPKLTGISQIYSIFAKPLSFQKASPGLFNTIQMVNSLPFGNLFGDGYAKVSGKVGGGLFGSEQLTGTIAGGLIGGAAGVGAGMIITEQGMFGFAAGSWLSTAGVFVSAAIGMVAIAGLMALLGCGKVEKVEITFTCNQWQRPFGSGGILGGLDDDNKGCGFCTKDPLKPCTKYRCESLGARCRLINENTGQEQCINDNTDIGIPVISPWNEALNQSMFKYMDISTNGFRIRDKNDQCLEPFTIFSFGVLTDVFAVCKISDDENGPISFEDMSNYFFEGTLFTKNHSYATFLPSAESIVASEKNIDESEDDKNYQEAYQMVLDKAGDINLHVKCANVDGKANEQDYRINLCVKPGPDRTPPVLTATSPENNAIVALTKTEQPMALWVNEPSECKWDIIQPASVKLNEAYNELKNTMNCETNPSNNDGILGYRCNTTLPLAELKTQSETQSENKFYFLCKDQPWEKNESKKNIGLYNGGIYEYILKKVGTELTIESIYPDQDIIAGTEPISINISAETKGGAFDGVAKCSFILGNETDKTQLIEFAETNSVLHKQSGLQLVKGNWYVNISCSDSVGNTASGSTSFKLELDTTAPEITRVYYESGNLVVLTNENSKCYYNYTDSACSFKDATSMEESGDLIHKTQWNPDFTHYIRCDDIWGNKPLVCSMIVKPNKEIIISPQLVP